MRKQDGFTLIEIIVFIVITALMASTILLSLNTSLQKTPVPLQNLIAAQTAKQCMEWYLGQRRLNGYDVITCPSTSVPSFCTSPSGYTVTTNVSCTTINSDANYKTIAVTVAGKGDSATLTSIIASY